MVGQLQKKEVDQSFDNTLQMISFQKDEKLKKKKRNGELDLLKKKNKKRELHHRHHNVRK